MHSIYDTFAKRVTQRGIAPACISASEHEVRHDPQRADIFVEPDPARLALLQPLGLLGRLCRDVATLEFFHGTPGSPYVEGCLFKILGFRRKRRRRKEREPRQWILVSGVPRGALRSFGFRPRAAWGPGVYFAAPGLATGIVVASELPTTRDTLLVRLVAGKGNVFLRATEGLRALPKDAPERLLAVPVMRELGPALAGKGARRVRQLEEFRAMIRPMIEDWTTEWSRAMAKAGEEARAQALVEGVAGSLIEVYEARFGAVPQPIADVINTTQDATVLHGWVRLVATATKEEIAAAIVSAKPAPKKRAPAAKTAKTAKTTKTAKRRTRAQSASRATR